MDSLHYSTPFYSTRIGIVCTVEVYIHTKTTWDRWCQCLVKNYGEVDISVPRHTTGRLGCDRTTEMPSRWLRSDTSDWYSGLWTYLWGHHHPTVSLIPPGDTRCKSQRTASQLSPLLKEGTHGLISLAHGVTVTGIFADSEAELTVPMPMFLAV